MTRRTCTTLAVAALATAGLAALAPAAPVLAVTNAGVDAVHFSVGMLMPRPDNGKLCSGTLVSPRVFLTAGHCVAGRLALGASSWSVSFSGYPLTDPGTLHTGRLVLDPQYDPHTQTPADDLGAVVFDDPVTDIAPTAVTAVDRGSLATGPLELVGYGATDAQPHSGSGTRRSGPVRLQSLTPDAITVTGDVSGCAGDSGGALLVGDRLAGVLSTTTPHCDGWTGATRLDTPEAQRFLAGLG